MGRSTSVELLFVVSPDTPSSRHLRPDDDQPVQSNVEHHQPCRTPRRMGGLVAAERNRIDLRRHPHPLCPARHSSAAPSLATSLDLQAALPFIKLLREFPFLFLFFPIPTDDQLYCVQRLRQHAVSDALVEGRLLSLERKLAIYLSEPVLCMLHPWTAKATGPC
jgi:hypothetical protein